MHAAQRGQDRCSPALPANTCHPIANDFDAPSPVVPTPHHRHPARATAQSLQYNKHMVSRQTFAFALGRAAVREPFSLAHGMFEGGGGGPSNHARHQPAAWPDNPALLTPAAAARHTRVCASSSQACSARARRRGGMRGGAAGPAAGPHRAVRKLEGGVDNGVHVKGVP